MPHSVAKERKKGRKKSYTSIKKKREKQNNQEYLVIEPIKAGKILADEENKRSQTFLITY